MNWILDVVAIAIVAVAVFFGYRHGFIRTLIQLVGWIAAFVAALLLSKPAAGLVFDTFIADGVQTQLMTTLADVTTLPQGAELETVFEGLPAPIVSVIAGNEQLQAKLSQLGDSVEASAVTLVDTVMETVVRPITVALLQFVIFIVLFLVLMFVVKLLSRLIKPVTKLPLIRQLDGTFGAVLGFGKGLILLFALVTVVELITVTGGDTALISAETLDSTVFVKWFADINPIGAFLN